MVAPMEGAVEEQDVDEKMDEELPVEERTARVVRKPGVPTPGKRSANEGNTCRASDPGHRLRPPVRIGEDEHGDQRVAGHHTWTNGHQHLGNLQWKGRSRCHAVLASGVLVLSADQETSLTALLDEIKARRAETLVERTAVESQH